MKPAVSYNNINTTLDHTVENRMIGKKKMKANKTIVGVVALAAVIGLVGAYNFSNAYRGDYTKKGPNYSEERHTIMEKAFENNDYNTWKEQMNGRGRVTEVINEDNFSKFAEAHRLAESGDVDGANKIREELGLRTGNGKGMGGGYGRGRMHNENRGQNRGGNFVDADGDGQCDNLNK